MYLKDYKRWYEADSEDDALTAELEAIDGNEEEINEPLQQKKRYFNLGGHYTYF